MNLINENASISQEEPKWEKAHPERRVVSVANSDFGNWQAYMPLRDYVLFGKVDRTTYKGLQALPFGFFGELPYGIVLKVGPDVKGVFPGQVVDFTAGFWVEIEMAAQKVRPNTLMHTVKMDGHEYGLVSAGFIVGARAQVSLEETDGVDESTGDFYRIHYDKGLIYYAESKEKMEGGVIKRKEPLKLE